MAKRIHRSSPPVLTSWLSQEEKDYPLHVIQHFFHVYDPEISQQYLWKLFRATISSEQDLSKKKQATAISMVHFYEDLQKTLEAAYRLRQYL